MLNPLTNQTFEEILHDIGNMVTIEEPPVTGLFTEKRPHKKVPQDNLDTITVLLYIARYRL